eukprot:15330-Pelagococcus_subviridis.AAC.5
MCTIRFNSSIAFASSSPRHRDGLFVQAPGDDDLNRRALFLVERRLDDDGPALFHQRGRVPRDDLVLKVRVGEPVAILHEHLPGFHPDDVARLQRLAELFVVRHREDGPFPPAQAVRQRVHRADVEVVGRLVEQQNVPRAKHERRERDARLFSAAQRPDRPKRHVAAHPERAERVPRLFLLQKRVVLSRGREHVIQRSLRGRELLREVLREDADFHAFAHDAFAADDGQRPGERFQQRRLPRAVRAEDDDPLPALELQRALQDGRPRVVPELRTAARARASQLEDVVVRRRRVHELEDHLRRVTGGAVAERRRRRGLVLPHLDAELLEELRSALRLARLARVRAEPANEILQLRGFDALLLVQRLRDAYALVPRL